MMKSIKNTLSTLIKLSATASLGDTVDLVRQKGSGGVFHIFIFFFTAISTYESSIRWSRYPACCMCLYLLDTHSCDIQVFQAAKGVESSYDTVIDLLESIESFLRRIDIYTQIPHTTTLDKMVLKIIMELLSTLALATKELKQERSSEYILTDVLPYSMTRSEIGE